MKFTKMVKADEIERKWILIDATDKTFGRMITQIATILRGKNKPFFTPHVDCGDFVVVINASKARFSGNKLEDKKYYTHSGYFGSTKTHKMSDMLQNNPEKLFKLATRGMLPKTKLARVMIKKLKVYAGGEHPHTAQFAQNDKADKHSHIKVGKKPKLISKPKQHDNNLELIQGIGKVLEHTLNDLGVYTFEQIAAWNKDNIAWVNEYIAFPGRIEKEGWVEQAKHLAKGEKTEFSKRVEHGDVPTSRKSTEPKE